jgi:serine/threonine protein kinase
MLAKEVQLRSGDVPDDWGCEAADFINKLIKRKPESRLGSGSINEIKRHPWLQGLNWEKLRSKDIESPFIPMMKKSHFDQDEQITIEDEEEAELIEKNSLLLRKP